MDFDFSPALISLKITIVSTMIVFILGLYTAWLMSHYNGPRKAIIDGILTLPLVLPPTVVGFVLLFLIGKNGPLGVLLETLDIKIIFSWYAGILSSVIVSFPLMYRTTRGTFEQINSNLLDTAKDLGANNIQTFWKIVVPISWPGIAAGTALAFARSLGEFGATLMVVGNIPGKTQTIPIAIYFATQRGDMKTAGLWVFVICIFSLISTVLFNNYKTPNSNIERN